MVFGANCFLFFICGPAKPLCLVFLTILVYPCALPTATKSFQCFVVFVHSSQILNFWRLANFGCHSNQSFWFSQFDLNVLNYSIPASSFYTFCFTSGRSKKNHASCPLLFDVNGLGTRCSLFSRIFLLVFSWLYLNHKKETVFNVSAFSIRSDWKEWVALSLAYCKDLRGGRDAGDGRARLRGPY